MRATYITFETEELFPGKFVSVAVRFYRLPHTAYDLEYEFDEAPEAWNAAGQPVELTDAELEAIVEIADSRRD